MSFFKNLFKVNKPKTVLLPDGIKEVHLPKGFECGGLKYRLVNQYNDDKITRSTAFYKDNTPFIDYKKGDFLCIRLDNLTILEDKRDSRGPSTYRLKLLNESEITLSVELTEINAEQLSKNSTWFPVFPYQFIFICEAGGEKLGLDMAKDLVITYFDNYIWGYRSRYNCPLNERSVFFQQDLSTRQYKVTINEVKFELAYNPEDSTFFIE